MICSSNQKCKIKMKWWALLFAPLGTTFALDCDAVPTYEQRSYQGGELVVKNENVYECKNISIGHSCGNDPAYEPGVGPSWRDVWNEIAGCSGMFSKDHVTNEVGNKAETTTPNEENVTAASYPVVATTSYTSANGSDYLLEARGSQSTLSIRKKKSLRGASAQVLPSTSLGMNVSTSISDIISESSGSESAVEATMAIGHHSSSESNTVSSSKSLPTDTKANQFRRALSHESAKCPKGMLDGRTNCQSSPDCCAEGYCYEKNKWWASCREKCTKGEKDNYDTLPWSCIRLTSTNTGSNSDKSPPTKYQKNPEKCSGKEIDITRYYHEDKYPPNAYPPLDTVDTPQFVALSFDDNGISGLSDSYGGMDWLTSLLAKKWHSSGFPVRVSFFFTSMYIRKLVTESPTLVKRSWHRARKEGHEIGIHSDNHPHGRWFDRNQWSNEIEVCKKWLMKPFDESEKNHPPNSNAGIGAFKEDIVGSRAPYLEYNNHMMDELVENGIWYDTSIEEGWQSNQDGTNYLWPYTLDKGRASFFSNPAITSHPGLWEMPVYPLIVPPDSVAREYGISPGLRAKCKRIAKWFDDSTGKVTGFDYNLWVQFQMTGDEFLATLKYSLDLRLEGNRAPFMPGFHSDYYSDTYSPPNRWASPSDRRKALNAFIDYALSKPEVRMVPIRDVLDWMRNPIPLGCVGAKQ